jgi:hypothetical protein
MSRCKRRAAPMAAACLAVLAGCIGGGARGPEWVRAVKSSAHPDSEWLIGVGRGKNPLVSDNVARSELSKPIEVQIKSEVTALTAESTRTVGNKTTSSSRQSVTDRIVARTDIKLVGVEIADRWHDTADNVYYSLAVLNRKQATAGLREEAGSLAEAANKLLAHAREKAAAGDKPSALSAYRRAMVNAVRHGVLAARLRVVGKQMYVGEKPEMSPTQIELVFRELAEQMRIAVVVSRDLPGHDEAPCPLVETELIEILQAEGLTVSAVGDEIRSLGHAGLTGDLSRTRDALAGRAAYIVVGKVKVEYQGPVKRLNAHGYQASGEGVFIDLDMVGIIANVSFPATADTRHISMDHGAAARGALEKAAPKLVEELASAVKKALLAQE